jgi:hypothetical protein
MSISLVGTPQVATSSGTVASQATSGMNIIGATLLVVVITYFNSTTADMSVSSTNNATGKWTALSAYGTTSGTGLSQIFYCVAPTTSASEIFTVSTTLGGGDYLNIVATAFSGTLITSSVYQAGSNTGADDATGTATTIQPGSVTPSQTNTLIVTGIKFTGVGVTASIDSSFSIAAQADDSVGSDIALGYLIDTSSLAINPKWTVSVAGDLASTIAVFLPAASAGYPGDFVLESGSGHFLLESGHGQLELE